MMRQLNTCICLINLHRQTTTDESVNPTVDRC